MAISQELQKLIDRIKSNDPTLTSLNLIDNLIDADGAKALADALKENNTLHRLDISSNYISDAGAKHISTALEFNNTLHHLNLSGNKISDAGAKHIANALKVNNTLTSLNLSWINIRDAGAKHIAYALKTNKTLVYLDLSDNFKSTDGEKALAHVLKENKNIIKLNGIDNRIVQQLVEKNFADARNNADSIVKLLKKDTIDVTDPDTSKLLRSYIQRRSAVNQILIKQHGEEAAQKYIYKIQTICDINFLFVMGVAINLEAKEVERVSLAPLPPEILYKIATHLDLSEDIKPPSKKTSEYILALAIAACSLMLVATGVYFGIAAFAQISAVTLIVSAALIGSRFYFKNDEPKQEIAVTNATTQEHTSGRSQDTSINLANPTSMQASAIATQVERR